MNKSNYAIPLVLFVLYILGAIYLYLPPSTLPTLEKAVLSNEPGDTTQNPDQRGYFTNLTRQEVIIESQNKFRIYVFGKTLPNYRLNYRPEEAFDFVRDQMKSNYLEEIIYPLHSSVFVNGWEPRKAPRAKNTPENKVPDISIYGIPYEAKVTFRPVYSSLMWRLVIWTAIFPASYFVYLSIKKSFTIND